MAKYDPDRITEENFDYDDMEMVQGYLDHPNTTSMHEELSRQFLASPPAEQMDEVERMRDSFSGMLAELEIVLANTDPPADDLRWQLAAQLRSAIDAAADRISELRTRMDGGD